jgi:putative oxygen-independent coproporphyrinogen III oxidase
VTRVPPVPVGPDAPGFGVYLHWPFCASKCPYCDFNSHVRQARVDEDRFAAAFDRALAGQAALAPGRTVTSIFLGGGTPSLMRPATVGALLDSVARYWSVASDAEVSLEANPTSVEAARLAGYRTAGVNRLSMGIQAMNDADLRVLGRLHTAEEAMAAVKTASRIFERYSFDLIYARPGQTPSAWKAELKEAVARAAEHLSLYQLTIEPGTTFERLHAAGRLAIPDPDLAREFYDLTQEVCEVEGLPAYEISNHARPGAESRHNLVYWRYGEYAAAGPGAHARLTTVRGRESFVFEKYPETWLTAVESGDDAVIENELLSRQAQGDEMLLMGLRLKEGVSPARHAALAGRSIDENRVTALIGDGLLERSNDGRIRATMQGVPVIDAIVAHLVS